MADEFSIINQIFRTVADKELNQSSLRVIPGDDAALLNPLKNPVITTDTQRENIHFRRDWLTLYEIGFRAVAVTLSDLAASYARPVSFFVNLGLPGGLEKKDIPNLYKGLCDALSSYNCSLGGGNISDAEVLSLDLFAIGEGNDIFPLRSAAKPGEGLFLTGRPGTARGGLFSLLGEKSEYPALIKAFKKPAARFDAAAILREHGVACVMDLSDGLAGDAAHIAKASGVSIELQLSEKDVHTELIDFCLRSDLPVLDMALAGGEEYELLFTTSESAFEDIKKSISDAVRVGVCKPFHGKHILNPPILQTSFRHHSDIKNGQKK